MILTPDFSLYATSSFGKYLESEAVGGSACFSASELVIITTIIIIMIKQ